MSERLTVKLRCTFGDLILPCKMVLIPHLKAWQFVVHKSANFDNDWAVSERESGFAVAFGSDEQDATENAIEKLSVVSVEMMQATVERAAKRLAERDKSLAA